MLTEMFIIVVALLVCVGILLFVIVNNKKDRKKLEDKLNQDYEKPKKHHGEIETEGLDSI